MSEVESLLILGDIAPIRKYKDTFAVEKLLDFEVREIIKSSYCIANLETTLTTHSKARKTNGPSTKANPKSAEVLSKMGVDAVTLANNHIMDFGEIGLNDTIASCSNNSISTFGAGASLDIASEPLRICLNGRNVLVWGIAESEFSIASEVDAGAFPADPIDFIEIIAKYKNDNDFVVVLLHMGMSMYELPSPKLQKLSRFMIENGANVVICQHSHCVGTYESYKSGLIVYGQGNFLYDGISKSPRWYLGIMIKLEIGLDGLADFQFVPFKQSKVSPYVRLLSRRNEISFFDSFEELSGKLSDASYIATNWSNMAYEKRDYYLSILAAHSRYQRAINRLIHFLSIKYNKKACRYILNCVRSETHRECLLSILDKKIRE